MDLILQCGELRKTWGGVRALDGVDLAVRRGEIVGLAGPNGAGKSTLLNAIGGQVALDSGRVALGAQRIERLRPVARRRLGIGRTFQAVRIFMRMTVLENVALAAEYGNRRIPPLRFGRASREEALAVLALVGLDGMTSANAGELSVNGQKRLMLAMALVPFPTLLLLDEPAGGLSPEEVDETVALIEAIRQRGTTVIVVDHVMSFLRGVVDRLIVMHEGRVLVDGLPDDVVEDTRVRELWLGHASGRGGNGGAAAA